MAKILVVEDNRDLVAALAYNLELDDHEVKTAVDGPSGLATARSWGPDLLILDLMLPGMDGYTVLDVLRREGFQGPVLVLTARGEESDRVRGFRAGADQYLTKPFGLLELIERVRLLLRRHPPRAGESRPNRAVLRFGDLEIDPGARVVLRGGTEAALSPKAFDLLLALIRRNGAVASRAELLREVWGHRAVVLSRTVDTHIKELRRQLEHDPADPKHVRTVWKAGYRWVP